LNLIVDDRRNVVITAGVKSASVPAIESAISWRG
jgi:hypothetical protein